MSWDERLDDLARRQAAARAMGGGDRLRRQREGDRLDARDRLAHLLDKGSFTELGTLVGTAAAVPADGLIAGLGAIDGRPVLVGAEDFTVLGGSIGVGTHAKRYRLAELAAQERVPLVMLLDGAGERATNALERYPRSPNDLQALVRLSGLVPTVAVVMGPSAGHGALTAPLMDLVVMVEGAALFSAGPPLVEAAIGEKVGKEELGGTRVHAAVSGVAHNVAPDDRAALDLVRRYLSFLPSAAGRPAPITAGGDQGPRRLDAIVDLIPSDPRQGYDVRAVVRLVADGRDLLEVQPAWGASMVTGLLRLGGRPVAVVANQPAVKAGAIDGPAADKAARFLEVADAYGLPVLFLADNPGVLAGTAAEASGVLRRAARMYAAQGRLRSPKLHVTLRKAYGFGSSLMAMNAFDGQTLSLALPGARLGAMPAEGGGRAAGAGADQQAGLDAAELTGAYRSADTMGYDEIVDPRDLRDALLAGLDLCAARLDHPAGPGPGIRP